MNKKERDIDQPPYLLLERNKYLLSCVDETAWRDSILT